MNPSPETGPVEERLCPFCESPVWSDDSHCVQCGAPLLPGTCRDCRESNPPEALSCGRCGSLNLLRAGIAPAQPPPQPDLGPRRRLIALLAAVLVAASGVLGAAVYAYRLIFDPSAPAPRSKSVQPPRRPRTPAGQVADFSLLDQDGLRRSLSGLADGRPIVLYGFSGDCGHCHGELGRLAGAVGSAPPAGVVFVGLMHQGNPGAARALLATIHLPGSILADADGAACASLGVGEFTLFVLDRERRPVYRGGIDGMSEVLAHVGESG